MTQARTATSVRQDGGSRVLGRSAGITLFWARLGWAGLSPVAPGTAATALVGIPCVWLLSLLPIPVATGGLAFLFFTACYVSDKAATVLGREDPNEIVVDELVGFLVTMVGLPVTLKSVAVGFLAFRLFDIWKPWPVRRFDEQLHGGLGIVMDDVAAGCYAHAVVWGVLAVWP